MTSQALELVKDSRTELHAGGHPTPSSEGTHSYQLAALGGLRFVLIQPRIFVILPKP